MEEIRIDMRDKSYQNAAAGARNEELVFKLNHTLPTSQEYKDILHELFDGRIGENSFLHAPLAGAAFEKITIGSGVYINSNLLAMARGGITIEDDVQIAANVQLLTNNHDPYDRQVLTCKPIVIRKGAWICVDWGRRDHLAGCDGRKIRHRRRGVRGDARCWRLRGCSRQSRPPGQKVGRGEV